MAMLNNQLVGFIGKFFLITLNHHVHPMVSRNIPKHEDFRLPFPPRIENANSEVFCSSTLALIAG